MWLQKKMEDGKCSPSAIAAFESTFKLLVSGESGMIPESSISPASGLDDYSQLKVEPDASLLNATVMLKLNGGLGTGMGLDKAKSLLKVKGDDTFLDFIAKQVVSMREEYKKKVKFMLMNSFSTSEDTLSFLGGKYPKLVAEEGLEMIQNKVPKIDATTYEVSMKWLCMEYCAMVLCMYTG
jgi:UDP-N-acetylglucosamine pyrophosphorylase